jgi:hypothetical protein
MMRKTKTLFKATSGNPLAGIGTLGEMGVKIVWNYYIKWNDKKYYEI